MSRRLPRGIAWLDTGTHESLVQATNFVQAVEERQGQMMGCPEEIAYRLEYITGADLERLASGMKGSPYGQYLLRLLEGRESRADHMPFTFTPTALPGVIIIEPAVFADSRGFFMETYKTIGVRSRRVSTSVFVQENHSRSVQGTLRGLHLQRPPRAQGKLVRVVAG